MAEQRKKTLYRLAVTAVGIVVLFTCVNFGSAATVFIGIPTLLIACGIAAGARLPYNIPFRDTLLYVAHLRRSGRWYCDLGISDRP
jgi:hypothetical protein